MPAPFETRPDRVVVDVWSDIMCPFCAIGDAVLARAVERFGRDVDVRYHAFQLMPDLPADSAMGVDDLLEKKKGMPRADAEAMNAQVAQRAAQEGLSFDMPSAKATNTLRAHRLIQFADTHGRQHDMVERLFRAYFSEGVNVGDVDALVALAAGVGLDADEARRVLEADDYTAEVAADVDMARQLGIGGVPFFVFDARYAVSGAQAEEAFTQALETAWSEHADAATRA